MKSKQLFNVYSAKIIFVQAINDLSLFRSTIQEFVNIYVEGNCKLNFETIKDLFKIWDSLRPISFDLYIDFYHSLVNASSRLVSWPGSRICAIMIVYKMILSAISVQNLSLLETSLSEVAAIGKDYREYGFMNLRHFVAIAIYLSLSERCEGLNFQVVNILVEHEVKRSAVYKSLKMIDIPDCATYNLDIADCVQKWWQRLCEVEN